MEYYVNIAKSPVLFEAGKAILLAKGLKECYKFEDGDWCVRIDANDDTFWASAIDAEDAQENYNEIALADLPAFKLAPETFQLKSGGTVRVSSTNPDCLSIAGTFVAYSELEPLMRFWEKATGK